MAFIANTMEMFFTRLMPESLAAELLAPMAVTSRANTVLL